VSFSVILSATNINNFRLKKVDSTVGDGSGDIKGAVDVNLVESIYRVYVCEPGTVFFSEVARSRLIIKNLPKNLTETKFREHFATKGRVTDAKIMKTPEGTSRCFGFVGYSTEQEANNALKYFHNTFIFTSRIAVERAKPVNDSSLPRPWSAHSLREFIEVMKPRSKSKTWANDDLTASENQESKNGKNIKEIIKAQEGSDDELYQDMPTKSNDAGKVLSSDDEEDSSDRSDEDDDKLKDVKNSVSDTDWLKSRMRRKLDWVADDEEDEEDSLSEGESNNAGNIRKKRKVEFADDVEINDSDNQQSPKDKDSMMQDENPHNERSNTVDELPPEESIGETGRLFVRNLPYICTEEDLRKEFNKFGPLAEVHMPLDRETKKQKGFAYVLYHIPEHAVKAYIELDNKFFMGRLLHILPSKEKPQSQHQDPSKWSLKKKKEMKLKSQATNDFNWSTLYMNSDTIAESIAHRFNIKKSDILDPESDNLSARLALAETHIIQETKAYLELNGVTLNSFEKKERSDTVIL
ncbi:3742_t:CDS:2, partial [Acaulospora morrowiae]